jgi:hypothetical protein
MFTTLLALAAAKVQRPTLAHRRLRAGPVSATTTLAFLSVAAALGPPAIAQVPQPTLQFDRSCYTESQHMPFTGAGYSPGGEVNLLAARPMDPRGSYTTHADAAGSLNDYTLFPDADVLLREDEERESLFVTATDRTRAEAGQQPPESQFGVAQLTFTRWAGFSPGRYVPGKRVNVELYGWAFAAGKMAWLQFRHGSRTVASVKAGRLDQECGDRKANVKVPRTLKPGRYRIVLSTAPRGLAGPYTWRSGRVVAEPSASSAATPPARPMTRVTAATARRRGAIG